jgi:hypothetical protein
MQLIVAPHKEIVKSQFVCQKDSNKLSMIFLSQAIQLSRMDADIYLIRSVKF